MDKFILKTRCKCMHYSTNLFPDDFESRKGTFLYFCSHCGSPLTLTKAKMDKMGKSLRR